MEKTKNQNHTTHDPKFEHRIQLIHVQQTSEQITSSRKANMREVSEQLVAQEFIFARDHDRESLVYEDDFQKLSIRAFDLSHRQ